jgi:hypothetical protein
LSMKETEAGHSLLDEIASLSSRGESGRLQITAVGSRGAFFFKQGKLVDARMGLFTGLPAVNLAVSLGEIRLSFDPSIQPPISTFTELRDRTLLKARFGIDVLEAEEIRHQPVAAKVGEHIFETTPQGSRQETTLPGKNANGPNKDAPEAITESDHSALKEFPSFVKTSRFSTQAQAVSPRMPPPQSQEISALDLLPLRLRVKGSLKQNSREEYVLSACVIFLIVIGGAVAAGSYWRKGNLTQPLDAQRPASAERSLAPPLIHDAAKSKHATKAVSAERQPQLNNAAARINLNDAKTGPSEVQDRIIKNTTNTSAAVKNLGLESVDKPTSRAIEVMVQIEDGHVTEAYVPNPQVGLAAYEATALRMARERRYPKDTSRKQSLTLKVTRN